MCHADEHWTEVLPLVLFGIKEDMEESIAEFMYGEPIRIPASY